jgi:hypothetical protein
MPRLYSPCAVCAHPREGVKRLAPVTTPNVVQVRKYAEWGGTGLIAEHPTPSGDAPFRGHAQGFIRAYLNPLLPALHRIR